MSKSKFHCKYDELVKASELNPNPRNPNQHSAGQIAALAKILEHQGWRSPVVISDDSGFIVSGHGRVLAALQMGDQRVPISRQSFQSEAEEWAHLIADNRLAELSEISTPALAELLSDLDQTDLDLELTGFDAIEIEKILLNSDLGAGPVEDMPTSGVQDINGMKMVQLYMTLDEFEEFENLCRIVSKITEAANTTDAVREALRIAAETAQDEGEI
tara:strand:- start:203 stop:850 length:648 start_codon:yes stop_codon:yes gene_type:complete